MNTEIDNQFDDDLDYQDYLSSIESPTEAALEPLPDLSEGRKPLGGRYVARGKSKSRSAAIKGDTVEDYKTIVVELEKKIEEICFDKATSSELKSDLIRYAAKQSGIPFDYNRIVQKLLEYHQKEKYGSSLLVIGGGKGDEWFQSDDRHLIDELLVRGELNIIGGLSGAAKTNVAALMLSALLDTTQSDFLGFNVNHDVCGKVFFIGLDGGKNVYTPIFSRAGLITDKRTVENFYFIPNETGWGITSSNLDKLEDLLKDTDDSIVVVDSLLAATTGSGVDENSAMIAARLMDLKLVCERHNATPIVLAHQKKDSTQEFTGPDTLRGHSSIPAFAGQVITLNFLDQKAKINGKNVPDRKCPKRRLVAGHRGTPIDLLIEIDFDNGKVLSHGDFYDALFSMIQQAEFDEVLDVNATALAVIKDWTSTMKAVFDCLMTGHEPIDQAAISTQSNINKGSVSRALTRLTEEKFLGQPFVQVIEAERKTYWVNDFIKAEVQADY